MTVGSGWSPGITGLVNVGAVAARAEEERASMTQAKATAPLRRTGPRSTRGRLGTVRDGYVTDVQGREAGNPPAHDSCGDTRHRCARCARWRHEALCRDRRRPGRPDGGLPARE